MENKVEFKVYGKYALFTDPLTKIGGEKCSYQIPTYQALKGIMESVYWKPTLIWFIDKIRVIKQIKTQTRSAKPIEYGGGNSLSIYTYLSDVEYQVQAHFEWNLHREDLAKDRNDNKHFFVAKRMIERGGRRDIFLGTRECQGYVEPCRFGEEESFYDNYGELSFDLMFHGFDYPDEIGKDELQARFWRPKMIDGVVEFIRPEQCEIRKFIRPMSARNIESIGLEEEGLLEGYSEEVVKR
ncbi:CRISPR-associated protein, Csd5d family [Syntrophobotulus glycolicus DSM 8271]|uniref:pre-crRNA processing endonuclease n=1 Tax=Syntrophobotulus glycolicus (strain DSM 8271 / FlGlyR) TaxID=645991 RepID=F0T1Y3_SYNGF|nr:type I-C CRISPR-associated protein Cas5c [Syntrophobotulus glycolicus]ADY55247.1 CRISPR-associated protein, Csd5d family [Syntrophobotulus glycolicus DSM 8271]